MKSVLAEVTGALLVTAGSDGFKTFVNNLVSDIVHHHKCYRLIRTVLVIGNSRYQISPLKNPVNAATDMANTLTQSGFNVNL